MANELDEVTGPVAEEGRDVNVIQKQIPVKVGAGTVVFEVALWVLGIIPGLIFTGMKIKAKNELAALQQTIQHNASQLDNYMEERDMILKNAAQLLDKAIDLDKDVLEKVALYRGGGRPENDGARNEVGQQIDNIGRQINVALENYPLQVSPDFSRIKVFSLTVNLGYTHEFDEDFWIGFGPVVNFNVYGSMLTEYSLYGDDIERLERHIRQRPITIDWMLRLGIMGVPLYLTYSGEDVLKDGGVKFRSLSFGLYL